MVRTYVVQELCTSISFNIMRVKVTPSQLDIDPELIARCAVQDVLDLNETNAQ